MNGLLSWAPRTNQDGNREKAEQGRKKNQASVNLRQSPTVGEKSLPVENYCNKVIKTV